MLIKIFLSVLITILSFCVVYIIIIAGGKIIITLPLVLVTLLSAVFVIYKITSNKTVSNSDKNLEKKVDTEEVKKESLKPSLLIMTSFILLSVGLGVFGASDVASWLSPIILSLSSVFMWNFRFAKILETPILFNIIVSIFLVFASLILGVLLAMMFSGVGFY
ncbi:MAG: hypothetical protein COU71_01720 [Parcubacteria group bacterium CG10_big_fil_rev_8_21_14_0_10_38_31]|nr:MAG: hypothetical protein COU71_01720 [Parcubacteria group bacterium CG10_big_fil_rev_8_21_14_0_10_38_31]